MIEILRKYFIYFLMMLLYACAGSETRQGVTYDSINKQELKNIVVDSDVEVDFKDAIVLMQQDKNIQAIEILTTVIEREQRLPAPYVNIAIAYNKLGDSKLAEQHLIKALKLDIGHPVANNELGLLYRKAGKFNAARTAYENAIKSHPEFLAAKRNLGVLCDLYMHDFECALKQFEGYLELKPEDKAVEIWIADVKHRLRQ